MTQQDNIEVTYLTSQPGARKVPDQARIRSLEQRVAQLEERLQQSNLISGSFVVRAFTVWCYHLAAQGLIVIVLMILLLALKVITALAH